MHSNALRKVVFTECVIVTLLNIGAMLHAGGHYPSLRICTDDYLNGHAGWEMGGLLDFDPPQDDVLEQKKQMERDAARDLVQKNYATYVANIPAQLSRWRDELLHLHVALCTDVMGDAKKIIEENPHDMERVIPTLNHLFAHVNQERAVKFVAWYREVHLHWSRKRAIREALRKAAVLEVLADLVGKYAQSTPEEFFEHRPPCVFFSLEMSKEFTDESRAGHTFVSMAVEYAGGKHVAVTSRCLHDYDDHRQNVFQKNHQNDYQYKSVNASRSAIFALPRNCVTENGEHTIVAYHLYKGMCGRHSEMACFNEHSAGGNCFAQQSRCDHMHVTHKEHLNDAWERIKASNALYPFQKEQARKEINFALRAHAHVVLTPEEIGPAVRLINRRYLIGQGVHAIFDGTAPSDD